MFGVGRATGLYERLDLEEILGDLRHRLVGRHAITLVLGPESGRGGVDLVHVELGGKPGLEDKVEPLGGLRAVAGEGAPLALGLSEPPNRRRNRSPRVRQRKRR